MASYKDILKEKENHNWFKGALALRLTKAGLRGLVDGDSCRLQQKIHSSVLQARNLTAGTTCKLCLTENLLRCPTNGLCTHPRNCKYHDSPLKMPRRCPTQVCDDFRDKICAVHIYGRPSWKNTNADQWCTNHWQVAKCFMPPDGYKDVTSFEETDFNGIISVMVNCSEFQRSLSFNISSKSTALTEAREIGRHIRHSSDLKVTDTDLADYFASLNSLLTDSKFLASDNDAQQAVLQLKQLNLEKGPLSMSIEDVRELLKEASAMIEVGKRELAESAVTGKQDLEVVVSQGKTVIETGKRELAESVETGKKALECVVSQGKNDIETCKRELAESVEIGKKALEGVVSHGKNDIETFKRELAEIAETEKQEIEGVVSQGKIDIETGKCEIDETLSKSKAVIETGTRRLEEKMSECQTALETGKRQLEDAMTTAMKRGKLEIEDAVTKSRAVVQVGKRELQETLQLKKEVSSPSEAEQIKDLRQRLVKYYQKQLNSASISPLLSDKDERLDKLYVPPNIVEKDHRRIGADRQQNSSPSSSYKQIFCTDEGLAKTVFVVGEAGMGKTLFSAMCAMKWATPFSVSIRDSRERGYDQSEEGNDCFEQPLLNDPVLRNVECEYKRYLLSLSYGDRDGLRR
ncbi:centrosome-associated protein CEP250-like [Mya arenaria]|uniref:centrosome-associated protein CEP250-like n=1 Tax=Mya arenaria TaxID=6604 RepID=UPI0022E52A3C|nr:centrosome-associated protein CEP250-like [Mya arenaria]XP_052803053.1 centrosome-associated protein CEP250-like [Mya arenaria]XP_052803054.1 centrosome-associated protein CEP250-like [Mya arenaria]XP_052803055.1 centrosome-associated protein CEP250-like [Mya arenaria]